MRGIVRRTRTERTLRREADMMGFTVAIAMLAAFTAGSDQSSHSSLDVLLIVWGTTVGLAVAHWFALTLSIYTVRDPDLRYTPAQMLFAQMVMALLIATMATVVVLLLPESHDRLGARITAALFIGVLAGVESRSGGWSLSRALMWGFGALIVAMAVATLKWFLGR